MGRSAPEILRTIRTSGDIDEIFEPLNKQWDHWMAKDLYPHLQEHVIDEANRYDFHTHIENYLNNNPHYSDYEDLDEWSQTYIQDNIMMSFMMRLASVYKYLSKKRAELLDKEAQLKDEK